MCPITYILSKWLINDILDVQSVQLTEEIQIMSQVNYPIDDRAAYCANSNNFNPRAPMIAPESRLIFLPPIVKSLFDSNDCAGPAVPLLDGLLPP